MAGRPCRVLELRSVRGTGGGPEKTILLGAREASERFEVVVCYIRDRRDQVFGLDARARDLDVRYVEIHERHSFDAGIWPQLRAVVNDQHIDIVHAHEYKTDLLAHLIASRAKVRFLATAHGWTGNSWRERHVYYPLDKRLLARFPRVIAVSSDIKADLVRHGARRERVVVVLNAISPEDFKRVPDRRLTMRDAIGCQPQDFVIGAVGRVERQKRFDLLVDAFAAVAQTRSGLRLVIAGAGSLLADLQRRAAELGIRESCAFLGHRDDVADLHQAFDLFVQSSEYEGTPNAVLEAMAMETPIVATDAGGTCELVRDGTEGLIVPPRNAGALEQAIRAILDDAGGAQARAFAARTRVESELSFKARTRRLEAIYEELMAEGEHSRA